MPASMYSGSPMGEGNPPGKYSKGYLGDHNSSGHFTSDASYRGNMSVGVKESATEVGNQPKSAGSVSLASEDKKSSSL